MNYSFFRKNAEKVRKVMREKGIDVFILTNQQKISYVAGTYHNDWNAGNAVFLWANREPTLLVSNNEKGRVEIEGYIKDIQYWNLAFTDVTPSTFIERSVEVLKEYGCEKSVIAVEEPSINWRFYNNLITKLPNATFVDGEDMINEIMMIKDEEELEIMRRVCAISDAGTQAIIENVRVGITEAELIGYAELAMRKLGCTYYYTPNQCCFDNRIHCDHVPTDRVLRIGDKICYDLHPVWHEYRSDHFRTIAFGQPDKEYAKMADFLTDTLHKLNEMLIPGQSTSEIERWFRAKVKEGGYPDVGIRDIGHGIGTGHLPPFFLQDKDWILQENSVVCISPYIFDPGNYNLLMEYMVIVRKNGPEFLHKHKLGLIVVNP